MEEIVIISITLMLLYVYIIKSAKKTQMLLSSLSPLLFHFGYWI